MRNSKIKFAITTIFLAGTIGTFSVFAHEGEGKGMMSSEGMQGMGGMMGMMPDMSPEDRKAMTDACMKMMQSHGGDHMAGGENDKGAESN
ncbi:hypothetical protein DXI23_20180 [Marinobacter flavimaris]|uniref:Uncharacterized protein n=1 Tax=Marinobacter flavimaris TaxID=262076 RepID=A0A3D8GXB2_9GAMM|nr:hypothetical protein [Marinobacter flavimaris]MCG2582578.1 hypothetical protein [Marinobacter sp.]PPI78479.1 hypothetical protein MDHKLMBL_19855 [Marinobacter flavimaris]RDU39087.1 hypothetical protein DXI23_20180 [Marinobacter flavimaris]